MLKLWVQLFTESLAGLLFSVLIILEPNWRLKGDTLRVSKRAFPGVSKEAQWLSKGLIKTRHLVLNYVLRECLSAGYYLLAQGKSFLRVRKLKGKTGVIGLLPS